MNGGTDYGIPRNEVRPAPPRNPWAVPASNPVGQRVVPPPPDGYNRVWDDGRINPQRGLPRASVSYATEQRTTVRNAAPRVPQGHSFVRLGQYSTMEDAMNVARAWQNRGMPMQVREQADGTKVVVSGPFGSGDRLASALSEMRRLGYPGASPF
jgi:hypothetical protein